MINFVSALGTLSIWIVLLPAFAGGFLFQRLNRDSKLIFFAVLAACVPQVLRPFMHGSPVLNILYNVYTLLEFLLYWILFYRHITGHIRKRILAFLGGAFLLYSAYLLTTHGISARFLNEWVLVSNIIQVFAICLCLLDFYFDDSSMINFSQPFFWFLAGITAYAPCTAIFFSLWYYIHADTGLTVLNAIHHVFNISLYLLFTIGFLKNVSPLSAQV